GAAARSGFAAAALLVFSGFHPEPRGRCARLVPPWCHGNCRHYFWRAALELIGFRPFGEPTTF
ncbi:MAG TPA: hypothetical protein VKP30_03160, partial [Polyangiaceae bacterium]|nr:hypothetical protein [Polyangiaceae bacterium]